MVAAKDFYVCEAGNPKFLGTFVQSNEMSDGAPVFSNEHDMSIFRNKNFWYMGDLAPWPPETHYRCVEIEGCNYGSDLPPTAEEGKWSATVRFGKDPIPSIRSEPCASNDEL